MECWKWRGCSSKALPPLQLGVVVLQSHSGILLCSHHLLLHRSIPFTKTDLHHCPSSSNKHQLVCESHRGTKSNAAFWRLYYDKEAPWTFVPFIGFIGLTSNQVRLKGTRTLSILPVHVMNSHKVWRMFWPEIDPCITVT